MKFEINCRLKLTSKVYRHKILNNTTKVSCPLYEVLSNMVEFKAEIFLYAMHLQRAVWTWMVQFVSASMWKG